MERAVMSARTACVVFGVLATTSIGGAQQGAGQGEWTRYGGDPGSTKYAPLDQINKSNISQLRIAWRRPAVDPSISSRVPDFSYSNNFRSTPLMIDGVLYSPNGIGLVEAFHPATGKTIWSRSRFPTSRRRGSAATAHAASPIGPTARNVACTLCAVSI